MDEKLTLMHDIFSLALIIFVEEMDYILKHGNYCLDFGFMAGPDDDKYQHCYLITDKAKKERRMN